VGTYQDQEAADDCVPCPYSHYQSRTGQTACVACSNGTFTSSLGSTNNSNCTECEECFNGLQCPNCQCVEHNSVCDGQANCIGGEDELGCATCNKTCLSHSIDYRRVCHADYALWIKVDRIFPSPLGTMISAAVYSLPSLQHRNTLNLALHNLHLDTVTQSCHCFQLFPGQHYFVTAYNSKADNKTMVTEDSIVAEWSTDVKTEIISLGTCYSAQALAVNRQ
jgi:hypothetical protein